MLRLRSEEFGTACLCRAVSCLQIGFLCILDKWERWSQAAPNSHPLRVATALKSCFLSFYKSPHPPSLPAMFVEMKVSDWLISLCQVSVSGRKENRNVCYSGKVCGCPMSLPDVTVFEARREIWRLVELENGTCSNVYSQLLFGVTEQLTTPLKVQFAIMWQSMFQVYYFVYS